MALHARILRGSYSASSSGRKAQAPVSIFRGQQTHRSKATLQRSRQHLDLQRRCAAQAAQEDGSAPSTSTSASADEFLEVDKLVGIRANLDGELPVVEYRVRWKDGQPDTWELASNLSPDLVRDFDERWWGAARKGDAVTLSELLQGGASLLAQVVDENRRSALHFCAAVGAVPCVQLLAAAGADLDLQDKDGYTPLHMAAGYMQTAAMQVLLEAGANPEIKDRQGKDVVKLVDDLRARMPVNAGLVQQRLALEQVANVLTQRLFEEVAPAAILERRELDGLEGEHEYLVQYQDERADEWLPERDIDPELIADWEAGLEVAPVDRLIDMRQFGTDREFLVKWADGADDSWETEVNVPQALIEEFAARRPDLFKKKKRNSKKKKAGAASSGGDGSSSSNGSGTGGGSSSSGEPPAQRVAAEAQQPAAAMVA